MKNEQIKEAFVVLWIFTKLGLTSFGGPVAHLAYFHNEFVLRRRWLSEENFTSLVALCQFLPGPASSQVGMAIGLCRAGYLGMILAWVGFTLPSAVFLILCAVAITSSSFWVADYIYGLKMVVILVVAQAVWLMGKRFCQGDLRLSIAFASAVITMLMPMASTQILVMLISAIIGMLFIKSEKHNVNQTFTVKVNNKIAYLSLIIFFSLLLLLPTISHFSSYSLWHIADIFYRAGSLVFGGGHLVLPILEQDIVNNGLLDTESFLSGYGLVQTVPGPLFTFAAYIGASITPESPMAMALFCLLIIFVPSFLLVIGVIPIWNTLQNNLKLQSALSAINASVVGLLVAAFVDPIFYTTVKTTGDILFLCFLSVLWIFSRMPVWLLAILAAGSGSIL